MGHVGSETRSQGHMLEKSHLCSRGHIFSCNILKLGQNVLLDEILDEFENGSCWVKNEVNRFNLRKTLCTLQRPYFQSDYPENWAECLS